VISSLVIYTVSEIFEPPSPSESNGYGMPAVSSFAQNQVEIEIGRWSFPPNHQLAFTIGASSASTSAAAYLHNTNHFYCRGLDVKNTYAIHLYRRLIFHGLRVFVEYRELQEGENLTRQIEGAITTSSSSWCLNELLLIPLFPSFMVLSFLSSGVHD